MYALCIHLWKDRPQSSVSILLHCQYAFLLESSNIARSIGTQFCIENVIKNVKKSQVTVYYLFRFDENHFRCLLNSKIVFQGFWNYEQTFIYSLQTQICGYILLNYFLIKFIPQKWLIIGHDFLLYLAVQTILSNSIN